MIILTASRRPTASIKTFCKFLERAFPDVIKITRGKSNLSSLLTKAIELVGQRLVVVDRWKGGQSKLEFFVVKEGRLVASTPTICLGGLKITKDNPHKISRIIIDDASQEVVDCAKAWS